MLFANQPFISTRVRQKRIDGSHVIHRVSPPAVCWLCVRSTHRQHSHSGTESYASSFISSITGRQSRALNLATTGLSIHGITLWAQC
jgi:hypothetical protein